MTPELHHIVFIDDEQDIVEITRLCLEMVGNLRVSTFLNGQTALACIDELNPDLIIIDCMMPGMSGSETFLELRKRPAVQNTPIIFMTARVQPSEIKEYLSLGAAGVIPKPFDPMKLTEQIQDIWGKHHEKQIV
ncbi:MAG: response regulator [Alphaproteobacteria bacterium]|nr:response regulator [Alphaproteobacteria bacterium]